jgi:hypothetical protein
MSLRDGDAAVSVGGTTADSAAVPNQRPRHSVPPPASSPGCAYVPREECEKLLCGATSEAATAKQAAADAVRMVQDAARRAQDETTRHYEGFIMVCPCCVVRVGGAKGPLLVPHGALWWRHEAGVLYSILFLLWLLARLQLLQLLASVSLNAAVVGPGAAPLLFAPALLCRRVFRDAMLLLTRCMLPAVCIVCSGSGDPPSCCFKA